MELQNLSRVHWVIVAVLVGLAVGFVYNLGEPSGSRLSVAAGGEFQGNLMRVERRAVGDPPAIRNLVLHPPMDGLYYATFEKIDLQKLAYVPAIVQDRQPWLVTHRHGADFTARPANLKEYLEKVKAANPDSFDYTYAWWDEPRWTYTVAVAGSVLLIGGVWPSVISLMIGAGLAPPRKPKEKKVKVAAAAEPEPVAPAKPHVDDADIAAVAAAYEARLAAGATDEDDDAIATPGQAASQPIRQLDGRAAEPVPLARKVDEDDDDEDKEFKGEFYPVAKVHHKKD